MFFRSTAFCALATSLLLSSCGTMTAEEKLSFVVTESTCLAQEARNTVMKAIADKNLNYSEIEKKTDEIGKKMESILKENFKSEQEMRDIYNAIPNKEEFEKKVKEIATQKCNADSSALANVIKSISGQAASSINAPTNTNTTPENTNSEEKKEATNTNTAK